MLSNRFQLVDREHISGHVGGIDFGYNLSCLARSPTTALFWSAGTMYSSSRKTVYGGSQLIVYRRGHVNAFRAYKDLGESGGRLTPARVLALAEAIDKEFDDVGITNTIAEAVKHKKTLLIEGGGEPFWPRRTREPICPKRI